MRRFFKILLLTTIINVAAAIFAVAQTDSPEILQTLEDLYSAGKYNQLLQFSQSLHDTATLSKEENLVRLKYTVVAYKDFGYRREADSTARLFWQKAPFYKFQKSDPQLFKEVMENYYTMSKFSVWMAAGIQFAHPVMQTVRPIMDISGRKPKYRISGYAVQLGLEYRPLRILSLNVAPLFTSYEMKRTMPRTDIATFRYNENFSTFTLPLIIEASLIVGRSCIFPSLYGGAQFKYLMSSKSNAYTDAAGIYIEISDKKDDIQYKHRTNYSVLGGTRLNFNHRRTTFFIDFGVAYDMKTYNNPDKKFDDIALMFEDLYIRDVFRMLEYGMKIGVKVNLQYKTIAKHHYGY